jgi:hypothetical protein
LLKGSGEGVFRLTESGRLQHVYDLPTFQSFGYDQTDIQAIADDSLAELSLAGELTRLLAGPDGSLDWVVQGQRWRIGRWQESLAASGYLGLPPSPADETLLAALPLTLIAEELPVGQIYREGNNLYGLFAGAELRPFQSEAVVTAYGYTPETSPDIPGEVRHLYRTGPPLTLFLHSDEGQAIFQMVEGHRRPVADEAAVFALGYGIEDIGRMPAEFLDQFPLEAPTATTAPPEPTATQLPPPATEEPPLTPSPTACPVAFDEVFLPLLKAADRATLGCPRAEAVLVSAASQSFEQGQMLWRGDRKVIYVLEQDGLWSFFGDIWQDGDDPFDPSIIVPEGLFQPVRGFGQVWREQPGLRASLGFALAEERGFSSPIQTLDNGLIWFIPSDKTVVILFNDGTYRVVVGVE